MKRLFTFCIALFSVTFLYAQADILLDDFENGTVSFTTQVNGNPAASMDYKVVDNPVKAGINLSNKVWEWKRFDASPDNKNYAGFYATLQTEVPTGYARIEVKYLRTNATSQLRIKVEGAVNKEFDPLTPATKTNEWETMVFDLTVNGIKNIKILSLFPDYYEPVDPKAITYIDDIKVIYDGNVIVPPTPSTYVLFDNSISDRFRDESYVSQTAPSTVVTENFDPLATTPGDKLPVVTSPVKAGANALKLQWKSVTGGAWAALTASVGFQVFDLKTFTHLKFWLNSPVALPMTALPMVYLEASGTPSITGKLLLANYLPNGLIANTWTEVTIPLADLWAANAAFIAKDLIKGVFFSQNMADNVEHTMYMDEFTFVNANTTGVNALKTNTLKIYYSNGEIRISDYSGIVCVYDLVGKNIFEGTATNGNLRVNLKKGIYIVNTTLGNSKISIQ